MKITKRACSLAAVMGLISITFYNCNSDKKEEVRDTNNGIFSFNASPTPPTDVPANASDTALAAYAWQEFLALNWKSSYGMNGMRGEPDTSWTFLIDTLTGAPDTLVWETYAHRSELSPATYPMRSFDAPSQYSYLYPPQPGAGSPSYQLFNNLDETSEIGSCNLFAFADSSINDSFLVRYQAKTNRVEYDYIQNTFPTQDSLINTASRTKAYYASKFGNPNTPPENNLLSLPNGSIEVKTAWRPLRATEDASKFLTRTVIVYSSQPISGSTYSYTNKTYGLIGMHIIHKSPNHPSFVFATWEHIGVQNDDMKYVLLTGSNPQTETLSYMPPIRNQIPTIEDLATEYVHQNLLPGKSVWQNYRLVGVQGTPTNDVSAPNFFLANYVIESDSLLARFHGSGFANPFDAQPNVVYNNGLYSVGGCQGCHGGGAQRNGTDFSFIVNAPNKAPDPVAGRPGQMAQKVRDTKLERLKAIYK